MPVQTNKICITNLPASTTYQNIQKIFKEFGTIRRVFRVCEDGTKTCSGRAYIAYKKHEEANMAKEIMNNKEFKGSTISIAIASEEEYSLEVPSDSSWSTQESTLMVTNEDKQRQNPRFSKSLRPRGPQGFPGMRPHGFFNSRHPPPHKMDQGVFQQQQQRPGSLGPPLGPSHRCSFPPGGHPPGPFQPQPHRARLPPSDNFNPQMHHSGHRPRESNFQPRGPWPGPPDPRKPNRTSPGDRPPSYPPGQSGFPSDLHFRNLSSDLSSNRYSAPSAPEKLSFSNVIAGLLKQINPNRAPPSPGTHQQPQTFGDPVGRVLPPFDGSTQPPHRAHPVPRSHQPPPTFRDPVGRVPPPYGGSTQPPNGAPPSPGTHQQPPRFHGPSQRGPPPFGVPPQPSNIAPQTPSTHQQPPTFHGPTQRVQPPYGVQTQPPNRAPGTHQQSQILHDPNQRLQAPYGVPTQPPNRPPQTPSTYQQPPTFHGPTQGVQPPHSVPANLSAADLVSLLASGGIFLRSPSDINNIPGTNPSQPQLQNPSSTARPTYTQASVPVHTSPAGPLQSPQASPALPSQNPPGYEVIKQVVREYIIDEKGNKIVREYERPLDQPPLRVPTGAVWGGQSAAEKPEWRAVKETGSALDSVTTDSGLPTRTNYQDADSTTELKQSERAQSKTKENEEDGTRDRSRSISRTSSQSRSSSRSRSGSRSKARSRSKRKSGHRKRRRSRRSSSSDSSREGSRHKQATRKKLPVVWVVGDSYVLRAVERAQGSTLGLDDIVDLHWKVLSEKQMLKNFKSMMDTLLGVSSGPPSMIVVHLGAYDFAYDPKDNFVGILKNMTYFVHNKMNCRLVWSEMFLQLDSRGQLVFPRRIRYINERASEIIQRLGEGNHFISYPRIRPSTKHIERDCLELTPKGTDYFIRSLRKAIRLFMKEPEVLWYPRPKCPHSPTLTEGEPPANNPCPIQPIPPKRDRENAQMNVEI
ncbi:uncharacterized protein [Asterias amurensis]